MAIRQTTHVLRNSITSGATLPLTALLGEPIVNLNNGVMYFSGKTGTATSGWTQSDLNPTFFEVGSNLYDLKIRNKITAYQNQTNLTGQFLSGTSNGFVLAPITSIVGVDTFPTGFTYSNNVFSITQNVSGPTLTALFNTVTGLTVNGAFTVTGTSTLGTTNASSLSSTTLAVAGTSTLGTTNVGGTLSAVTLNGSTIQSGGTDLTIALGNVYDARYVNTSGDSMTGGLNVGGTLSAVTLNGSTIQSGGTELTIALGNVYDARYVNTSGDSMTGNLNVAGTISSTTLNALTIQSGGTNIVVALGNAYDARYVNTSGDSMTGGLTIASTLNVSGDSTLNNTYMSGSIKSYSGVTSLAGQFLSGTSSGFVLAPISSIGSITNYQYAPTTNTFTITQSDGSTYSALINQMSGLTIGSGGSVSGHGSGDLVVHGNLTVFGGAISAFTGQLYVEDNNIYLNYNPSGSTAAFSIGAGLSIQDGSGISGSPVTLDIRSMQTFTGLTAGNVPVITEYVASTGYANRAFVTQLNDIVLRSTNTTTPNGVRVLAEFDVLDGGVY